MTKKHLIFNDDGWSSYMRYPAPMTPADIEKVTVGSVAGTNVRVYQFCALGGHAVNYTSSWLPRVGEMLATVNTLHVWRMRETLRHLEAMGTDPLRIVTEACHRHGLVCQFSLRMNDAHHTYKNPDGSWYFPELQSPWFAEHPEALLPSGQLDYAHPLVSEYRKRQIGEVLARYEVDGIDLDFTRFRPWFRRGLEAAGRPILTALVRDLRAMARAKGKTLSARFEYDPEVCAASGLDVDAWLRDGLLDQVTLGGIGDHTPDAPSDWWVEQAHPAGCGVFPGIEGQLHWCPGSGGGGTGLRPGNGVVDGYGPPSLDYMRAVAACHYRSGADGISLFNFSCADGAFSRDALEELGDPPALEGRDKQYVSAVWPADAQIYGIPWASRFRLEPGAKRAAWPLTLADDFARVGRSWAATLTLEWKGLNRRDDVEPRFNDVPLAGTGFEYNHYDHGCWNDTVSYSVPPGALRTGTNTIELVRREENAGFAGAVEVRKCVLDVRFDRRLALGSLSAASHGMPVDGLKAVDG